MKTFHALAMWPEHAHPGLAVRGVRAETELSVLSGQCLDRRIPDRDLLVREVSAWTHDRNVDQSTVDWRFTTNDSRIKLKRLYPAILP